MYVIDRAQPAYGTSGIAQGFSPLTQKPVAAAKKLPRLSAFWRSLSHWLACSDETAPDAAACVAISSKVKTRFAIS
jgi:hypothetical protein